MGTPRSVEDVRTEAERRWPRRVFGVGDEWDPRFALANERTFVAWIRTALGLRAARIALDVFVQDVHSGLRRAVALVLIAAGTWCGISAYLRWMTTERALRLGPRAASASVGTDRRRHGRRGRCARRTAHHGGPMTRRASWPTQPWEQAAQNERTVLAWTGSALAVMVLDSWLLQAAVARLPAVAALLATITGRVCDGGAASDRPLPPLGWLAQNRGRLARRTGSVRILRRDHGDRGAQQLVRRHAALRGAVVHPRCRIAWRIDYECGARTG